MCFTVLFVLPWLCRQAGVQRSKGKPQVNSLPKDCLSSDAMIFMNIPMDAETPTMRLLRPQALVQVGALDIGAAEYRACCTAPLPSA